MDLRRTLKMCMVVRANRIGGAINLQFHPEAPVDVERLIALAQRSPDRFKLSEDFQLRVRAVEQDWDGVVAEIQSVLQDLLQRPAIGSGSAAEAKGANE